MTRDAVEVQRVYGGLLWQDEALSLRLEGSSSDRTERLVQLMLPWRVPQAEDSPAGGGAG